MTKDLKNAKESVKVRSQVQAVNDKQEGKPILKMGGTDFYEHHIIRKMPLPSWDYKK